MSTQAVEETIPDDEIPFDFDLEAEPEADPATVAAEMPPAGPPVRTAM